MKSFLAAVFAVLLVGCSADQQVNPVVPSSLLTIEAIDGPVEVTMVARVSGRLLVDFIQHGTGKEYQIISVASLTNGITRDSRELIENGETVAMRVNQSWVDNPDYHFLMIQVGDQVARVEFLPQQRIARYTRGDNILELDDFLLSQLDDFRLKQSLIRVRQWMPADDVLRDNAKLLLMETVVSNDALQSLVLTLAPNGGDFQGGGCGTRVIAFSGLAAKYGCRFWAVPNPWISVPSATGCVVGNGLFWGCMAYEASRGPGDANAPPPAGGSGGGGSSGGD